MEIFLFTAGIVLGWAIQHIYSLRSSKERKELFSKLSTDLRDMIVSDPRDTLSVSDLNELIEQRTIDRTANEPLPYKACPKYGSTEINKRESIDQRHDEVYYTISC